MQLEQGKQSSENSDIPVFANKKTQNEADIMPDIYTIKSIAELEGENDRTIRNIVQELEKEGVLSTSNKEANKHREMNQKDYDIISKVVNMKKELKITYVRAIEEVVRLEKSDISVDIMDSMKREHIYSDENLPVAYETVVAYLKELTTVTLQAGENNRQQIAVLCKSVDAGAELLRAQGEEIDELKRKIESMEKTIQEQAAAKRKKLFGLF